jgi:hypothetical protein
MMGHVGTTCPPCLRHVHSNLHRSTDVWQAPQQNLAHSSLLLFLTQGWRTTTVGLASL